MERIGQPDEVADAVVWLLSDEARYVTGLGAAQACGAGKGWGAIAVVAVLPG